MRKLVVSAGMLVAILELGFSAGPAFEVNYLNVEENRAS